MCGICGEFVFDRQAPGPRSSEWQPLVRLMTRRGPDAGGLWRDSHCLMAFRRLTILDASPAANQPMTSPCGRYCLVFNGELYNYAELRGQLRPAVEFVTRGDAEVVLHALIRWGRDAFARFNGMFALALYDSLSRTLLLGRDHVGMKPLYVLRSARGIVFASQYDQIVRHSWAAGLSYDESAVATYLRYGQIPAPKALLIDTEMLAPGSWMTASQDGRTERGRYFHWQDEGDGRLSGDEADEALADVLRRAVARHVHCDVPVGCFMSGGVDSPLIASSLREVDAERVLPAFSIASTDPDIDESPRARSHADTIGLPIYSTLMSDDDAEGLVEDVMACTTEPLADEGVFPTLIVSRSAVSEVKVALSGEGADELFWGYVQRQCPFLREVEGSGNLEWSSYASFFVDMERSEFESCFPGIPWFERGHPLYDPPIAGTHPAYALRQHEIDTYLPSILLKTDRASMFHSLEVRMPFLDREVLDVARRLRWDDCLDVDRRVGKWPLRRLLHGRGLFPPLDKKGFTAPIDRWLRGSLKQRVGERLKQTTDLAGVGVDSRAVMRLWDAHQHGVVERGNALWRLFILGEWLARHGRGA